MIWRLAEGLGLVEREAEVALMTFHRFGNQSAASLWYQLAYRQSTTFHFQPDQVIDRCS